MTTQEIRAAIRQERDTLRAAGNEKAANALTDMLFDMSDAEIIRFAEIIKAIKN